MSRGLFFHGLPLMKAVIGPCSVPTWVPDSGWCQMSKKSPRV